MQKDHQEVFFGHCIEIGCDIMPKEMIGCWIMGPTLLSINAPLQSVIW